jgi:hypothetical protein
VDGAKNTFYRVVPEELIRDFAMPNAEINTTQPHALWATALFKGVKYPSARYGRSTHRAWRGKVSLMSNSVFLIIRERRETGYDWQKVL